MRVYLKLTKENANKLFLTYQTHYDADLLIVDDDLNIKTVIIGGKVFIIENS